MNTEEQTNGMTPPGTDEGTPRPADPKPKKGVLGGLFGKKDKDKKPEENNAFTQVFGGEGKKDDEDALLSTIIGAAQSEKEEALKKEEDEQKKVLGDSFSTTVQENKNKSAAEKVKKEERRKNLLLAAQLSVAFALLVPLLSWVTFETTLDAESNFSSYVNARNYGKELVEEETNTQKQQEENREVDREIKRIEQEVDNLKNHDVVGRIAKNEKVDFAKAIARIEEATYDALDTNEAMNNALKKVIFHSFSGTVSKKGVQISLTGSLREKETMTALTHLIDGINANEYFEGAELNTFSKTEEPDAENIWRSSFSFSLQYLPDGEAERDDEETTSTQK